MILRILLLFLTLFTATVPLGGCSGASLLNAVTSRAGYDVVTGIRYGEGPRGTYDLYVPKNAGPSTPVVVFIYGGGWVSGSKEMYLFVGQSLASEGMIVAIPDYRINPQVTFPAFVEDSAMAVAAVSKAIAAGENGVPAGKHPLFLMGHSAGAEIAALLALDGHYLKAAGASTGRLAGFIGLAGPYDFLPLKQDRYKRVFPVQYREASQPVNFVGGRMPPMLLIAGEADTIVDPKNTRSLAAKVKAEGGAVEIHVVPGVDHPGAVSSLATAVPLGSPDIRADVLRFIRERS